MTKKKQQRTDSLRGRTKQEREALRVFKGMPVRDAKADLLFPVDWPDVKDAVAGDPTRCVAARACKRLYGSTAMVIMRTVAYVDLGEENGTRTVYRFTVPQETLEKIIRPLDAGGKPVAGVFTLNAPSPTRTLAHQTRIDHKRRERERTAKLNGTIYPLRPGSGRNHRDNIHVGSPGFLRDGSGLIQMQRAERS